VELSAGAFSECGGTIKPISLGPIVGYSMNQRSRRLLIRKGKFLKTRVKTQAFIAGLDDRKETYDLKTASSVRLKASFGELKPRLYDTTGCQTNGCIVYTAGCQTGCTTRFHNRLNEQWLFVQPVVNRLYNRFDNRFYRVNGVLRTHLIRS